MRYMLLIPCILLIQQTYAANSSLSAENSSCISFKDNNAILSLEIELLMNIEVAHINPKNRSWSRTPSAQVHFLQCIRLSQPLRWQLRFLG